MRSEHDRKCCGNNKPITGCLIMLPVAEHTAPEVPVSLSGFLIQKPESTTSFSVGQPLLVLLFQAQVQLFHLATRLSPELTVIAANATTSCVQNMTGSAAVTINPLPAAYNVTGGGAYCAGGFGVPVGLSDSEARNQYQLSVARPLLVPLFQAQVQLFHLATRLLPELTLLLQLTQQRHVRLRT